MFNNSFYPYQNTVAKTSLFSSLKGKFNWSNLLNNTQKTLNIINQAIPVFYQIKPIWGNAKTIFKIMGAIKEDDPNKRSVNNTRTRNINNTSSTTKSNTNTYNNAYSNTPNFFL